MPTPFDSYLRKLCEIPLSEQTEHTGRSAIEALLNQLAPQTGGQRITIQHEPKREAGKGAPDFKVMRKGMILGYVEVKEIGENLDKVLKSDQIKRYRALSDNILLTDYLQWIWIDRERVKGREILAYPTDLESRRHRIAPERAEAVQKLIECFFSEAPQGIGRAEQLALALAARSRLLRDYLNQELERQEREHRAGRLYGLFLIFREQIFHELTLKEFADAFAQMLAYGLFLARLNSDSELVTLFNAREFIPGSFRLIRELVDFLSELTREEYRDIRWVVEEVLSIVNGLNLPEVHEDLSFRQRRSISRNVRAKDEEEHRLFERDPFIYFYEDYLKAYDPEMRKSRGVYYTPPPIVNFIIRAVDDILKESFGIRDGLADNQRVTVLDFACGTGTFLLEVFQRVFENIGGPNSARADLVVREHFLRHIFGFEYLIAPYTIAHLKLSQYLKDQGHPLRDDERLQVFLTNTMEPVEPQTNFLLPAISAEVEAAQEIKDREILVITGNPPYSGHSKNKGAWITAAIDGYKFTVEADESGREVEKPLGERNPKWLNDDYVKFIRFAQLKMDSVEEGVVGVITNHSWLDNPTFRGMRQSLMRSFEQIYVIDLHGNAKKKERAPDGSKDENVFDIEQGVAISVFVKMPGLERGVWRSDLWGKRLEKYERLVEGTLTGLEPTRIVPDSKLHMFLRGDFGLRSEYERGWELTGIFPTMVLGFQTHRDHFAIDFSRSEIGFRIDALRDPNLSDVALRERYDLKDNRDWQLSKARAAVRSHADLASKIIQCDYRPFDIRWCFFGYETMDYPRRELLSNVAWRQNICLQICRQVRSSIWRHAFVSSHVAESCLVSLQTREGNYAVPLRLYSSASKQSENFSHDFRAFLDARYNYHYSAEEVLGFVYAVLYAPTYRTRYAEFLRVDFPRILFPQTREHFESLSNFGWTLVQAHLLRELPRCGLAAYFGKGDHAVEAVRYSPQEAAIWINKTQGFRPVPQAVWDFHIGGYQVLDKYLKSRKGRVLSLDEINHVAAIADSLAFTIDQMAAIDEAYRAAFLTEDNV
jgi:Type ISP C-terminal specificity domain/N-6 DNA Methylase